MLVLTIKVGEHVSITNGADAIIISNTGTTPSRIGIGASPHWEIVRSDAKKKEPKNDRTRSVPR